MKGEELRAIRLSLNKTQKQFGLMLGYGYQSQISAMEVGLLPIPDRVGALARAIGQGFDPGHIPLKVRGPRRRPDDDPPMAA